MTLRSPPGASSSSGDHHRGLISNDVSSVVADDIPMPIPARSPKLLRTNSSKKVPAASNLERQALLSFNKSWEPTHKPATDDDALPVPVPVPPPSPAAIVHGANPATSSSTADAADTNEAATRLQKVFKGHRTRRTLADCAIVIEELWWKLYDSASLDRTSISFFTATATGKHQETAASRWVRAGKRIAKVGKGLSKDDKAQKLALRHWLEAIDPRHRYGHNLHLYYDLWFQSSTSATEPFFYWLDVGGGREVHHPACGRARLNSQLVAYLGASERAAYQVVVDGEGRLRYRRQTGVLVHTTDDAKWIFVLSTTRALYVGRKRKGHFQHSSFLAGGATSAAGRLVVKDGVLKAVWPYSGHYLPTEENFDAFIAFLQDNKVDLTHVKRCSVDDDECYPLLFKEKEEEEEAEPEPEPAAGTDAAAAVDANSNEETEWTSGAGARIGCVRDYPAELQSRALEQVNLSPNTNRQQQSGNKAPIPSPRPSPRIRMSPRVQYMGMGVPKQQQCLGLGIRPPTVRLTLPSSKNAAGKATTSSH